MSAALVSLVPVFLVLGLGVLLGRAGRIRPDGIGPINVLAMEVLIPAAVFAATIGAGRAGLLSHAGFCVAILATMTAMFALAFAVARRGFGIPAAEASVLALLVGFPNLAAIGLPVASGLGDAAGEVDAALGVAIGSILPSSITLAVLEASRPPAAGAGRFAAAGMAALAARSLGKPVVLAPLLGAALSLAAIALPAPVARPIGLLGSASAAVALILTGLVLSAQPFRPDRAVFLLAAARNLAGPPLAFAIGRATGLAPADLFSLVVLSAVPTGFFGLLFGLRYGVASSRASALLLLSTAASVATLPAWIASARLWVR